MKTKKQTKSKELILNTIPIFLAKTYRIVNNPQYSDIICWTEDGGSFIVKDIAKLTTLIFPKHFKHTNYSSFVRQLNMYGFHKIKSEEGGHTFAHEAFQKDQIQKLKDIKRRNGPGPESEQPHQTSMMLSLRKPHENQIETEINLIKRKHDDLQGFVTMLVDQNKEILMQNRNFVSKMSKMEEKYRNKLETLMLLLLFGKAKNNNGQPFILPQQFQNMLSSFNQENSRNTYQIPEQDLKKKKKKLESSIKMIRNQSQAQIQKKNLCPGLQMKQNYDLDQIISEVSSEKKQKQQDYLDEPLDFIPLSPNYSHNSFPEFYDKQSHNDMSEMLEKLGQSDFEDLGLIDDKQK